MNAEDYLLQHEKFTVMIQNKQIEQQQLREIAEGITSSVNSVLVEVKKNGEVKYELQNMERVQSSGSKQKMADALNKCVDLMNEIADHISDLINAKREITRVIERLPVSEYDVLHKIYIQGMTCKEVATAKRKSKGWVSNTHNNALHTVQRILNEKSEHY